jgi:hypothetical protein
MITYQDAITLAKQLLHGPFPPEDTPDPMREEARAAIREALRTCGHTWLTGEAALEALDGGKDPSLP